MKKHFVSLTLAAVWMGSAAVLAQAPTAPVALPTVALPTVASAKHHAKQVQGQVSAVDLTNNTVTVTTKKNPTGTTLTLGPRAKVTVTQPAMLTDIKTGDTVNVYSPLLTAGATTVTAERVEDVPAPAHHGKKANAGYHKNYVQGMVASTTPALTITTPGGVTVTVTTTAVTKVAKVVPGALSDITVGKTIQAHTREDGATLTATEIHVMPEAAKHGGRRHKKAAV